MAFTEHEGETFRGCRVRLDDNSFRNCTFETVIFEYSGKPFVFENNTVNMYVLSFQGEFYEALSGIRQFARSIGPAAVQGVADALAAEISTSAVQSPGK